MSHRIAYVLLALGVAGAAIASGCAEGTVKFEDDDDPTSGSGANSGTSNSVSTSAGNGGATSTSSGNSGGSSSSSSSSSSATSSSSQSSSSSANSSAVSTTASAVSSSSSGGPVCGDAFCDLAAGEDCSTCPGDCGPCGPVCGDAFCEAAGGEDCNTCPGDCGGCGSCAHDVCDLGAALMDGCSPCVTQVCLSDAYCCDTSWDGVCVGEAVTICGAPCNGGACAHDKCDVGGPLTIGCDPCVTQICQIDSVCCDSDWDFICVDEVFSICGQFCP